MGWASGSYLYNEVIRIAKEFIPNEKQRTKFHKEMIAVFQTHDWDTEDECVGEDPAFDAALKTIYPSWFKKEEE
jgi:hypothetical protein